MNGIIYFLPEQGTAVSTKVGWGFFMFWNQRRNFRESAFSAEVCGFPNLQ
jgi:hypothetical protein